MGLAVNGRSANANTPLWPPDAADAVVLMQPF